jgi:DNA-binding YbaB/EbfC family protein
MNNSLNIVFKILYNNDNNELFGGSSMARGRFPGMGGGNISNLMKQAQKMQKDMAKLQEELQDKTVEASAGGGAITVVATGKKEIQEIIIRPEVVDPDDIEMLQDLVLAAVNEALRKAEEMVSSEMSKITGGLGGLPGMF